MDEISLGVEFTKIDKQKRTVTGIATADNIDLSGDIVPPEATSEAFAKWVGNIREMHKPNAVGKAVSFRPLQIPYRGRMYNAIELEAYISRGSQDTWEKVLDGTLRGFSIGGKPKKTSKQFNKEVGRDVRVVEAYDLHEVSLVDNPCNPAAMISLVKRAEDGTFSYDLEMKKYQIYYCPIDGTASVDKDVCEKGHTCSSIGQVDEIDLEVISKMISNEKSNSDLVKASPLHAEHSDDSMTKIAGASIGGNKLQENTTNDNVNNVSDLPNDRIGFLKKFLNFMDGGTEEVKSELIKSETLSTTPVINIYTGTKDPEVIEKASGTCDHEDLAKGATCPTCGDTMDDTPIEKSVNLSDEIKKEEGEETMDLEKFMGDISALLDEKLTKVKEEVATSIDEKIETIQKSVDEKLETVEGRVESVESAGALKKSVDEDVSDDDDAVIIKAVDNFWGGMFVDLELVKALGYDS